MTYLCTCALDLCIELKKNRVNDSDTLPFGVSLCRYTHSSNVIEAYPDSNDDCRNHHVNSKELQYICHTCSVIVLPCYRSEWWGSDTLTLPWPNQSMGL